MRAALGAVAALLLVSATANGQGRVFTDTVDLDPGGTLRIVGTKGSIRVTSWDQPRVEIRARIETPSREDADYAARAVEATKIEVSGDRRAVTVASDYSDVPTRSGIGHWGDRTVPPVHFEIRAPRKIALNVRSDRGPAWVSGFEGTIDVVFDRGELDLRDVSGDLRVEIDRGEHSRMAGLRGSLKLNADRTDLEVDTHGLDRDSSIEIDRGELELRVPETQRLTVRTDMTRRADFYSDFSIQWSSPDLRRSEGHINGGGTALFVESDRGSVELRKRR